MKNVKSIIALLMAVVMLFGVLTGCGAKEVPQASEPAQESESKVENPKTEDVEVEKAKITIMCSSETDLQDSWFIDRLQELTGVEIEMVCYSGSVYPEKVTTRIASNDLPDIMLMPLMSLVEVNTYGDQGAFANVYDYVDAMPNFKSLFVDNAVNFDRYSAYNAGSGANYLLPIYGARDVNHGLMYRADVFKDLGIDVWTDSESFLNALRTIKEAYPDSHPFTGKDFDQVIERTAAAYDLNGVYTAYDYDAGEWFLGGTHANYLEVLKFFQTMFTEDLIDPDIYVNDADAMQEELLSDNAFICNDWIGRMGILNPQGQVNDADFDLVYGPGVGNGKILALDKFGVEAGMLGNLLVANNENTAVAMKVVDFLYSEEGILLSTVGEEGVNFEWDDNGKPVYPDMEVAADITSLAAEYGMWTLYTYPHERCVYFSYTDHEQAAQDLMNNASAFVRTAPPQIISEEDSAVFVDLMAAYKAKLIEFSSLFVMNSDYGEEEWNEWVEYATSSYSQIVDILNKA